MGGECGLEFLDDTLRNTRFCPSPLRILAPLDSVIEALKRGAYDFSASPSRPTSSCTPSAVGAEALPDHRDGEAGKEIHTLLARSREDLKGARTYRRSRAS